MSSKSVEQKNFEIIRNTLNKQAQAILELQERVSRMEGNLAAARAEMGNAKQMMGHLAGRGMGSTVHS